MPGVDGNANRETSGLGGSILITSAPRSSNVRAQSGPASTREKSTTRMPESGPLTSAPREFGEAGAVVAERGETDFEVFGGPDRFLDLGHCFVGREHPLIDGEVHETLRCRMRHRRPMRKFLGDGKHRILQHVVCDYQVNKPPALERCGIIAPPEHRNFLRAHRTGALHLPLYAAQQRMQSERDLDRTDLRRTRRDDVVTGECEFEPAAEADTVHARDDRNWQQFERFQEIYAADRRLAFATLLDARVELRDVGTCGKMAQPAAQNDCPAAGLLCGSDFRRNGPDQRWPQQIVRPVLHREHRDRSSFLAPNDDILHEHSPLQLIALKASLWKVTNSCTVIGGWPVTSAMILSSPEKIPF